MKMLTKTFDDNDSFTQYRYLRYPWDKSLRQIAFKLTLDHTTDRISYVFAICRKDENFNRKEVHTLLDKRMKSKFYLRTTEYDDDLSLVENMVQHIDMEYHA